MYHLMKSVFIVSLPNICEAQTMVQALGEASYVHSLSQSLLKPNEGFIIVSPISQMGNLRHGVVRLHVQGHRVTELGRDSNYLDS